MNVKFVFNFYFAFLYNCHRKWPPENVLAPKNFNQSVTVTTLDKIAALELVGELKFYFRVVPYFLATVYVAPVVVDEFELIDEKNHTKESN